MSEAALRATGLLQPGSLVRWNYQLKLPDESEHNRGRGRGGARAVA